MRLRHWLWLVVIAVVFALFLIWPIVQIVKVAFVGIGTPDRPAQFTLAYLLAVFRDPNLRAGLINSAAIAICVTILCTLIGLPLAVLSVRYEFPGKRLFGALLLVPLILPPFVGAIGMRQILGRFGALSAIAQRLGLVAHNAPVDWFGRMRLLGIVLVEALSLYPILYLNIAAALANLDPAMEQAAANLGASRWTIFRRITFPLLRPGLLAGAAIVLIWSFTELGTPLMFDFYEVTPVQVFHQLGQIEGNPLPYALVVVMMLGSIGLYIAGRLALGKSSAASVSKATVRSVAKPQHGLRALLIAAPFFLVGMLALVPHIGVVLLSVSGVGAWYDSVLPRVFTLAHYRTALSHELTIPSVKNSIVFSTASVVIDIVLGLAIAQLIVRAALPRVTRWLVDALAVLPLAVPGLVLAFGYLSLSLAAQSWVAVYARQHGRDMTWLKNLLDVRENPTLLLIIAYAMRRLPYVVRSAVAGLEQTPIDLELAARNLGASGARTMWRITVPLIGANLIAGALLAFAFAMLEVSDSLVLAQKMSFYPITKAIYELFARLGDGPYIAAALGTWAMALLTLTILTANSLLGRRMGALFRV